MLRRILTTGVLAGVAAGIFLSVVQIVAVDPLIAEAERLEAAASASTAATTSAGPGIESWSPEGGLERIGYTVLASLLAGVGFGFILAACFALYGGTVDAWRGLLWGLGGFAAFALAPALGLPPEAPGAAAAELIQRQAWWLGTVAATAAGLAVLVFARPWTIRIAGVVVLALPHLIGAPHIAGDSLVPSDLVTAFIVASLATTGLFWLALGGISGAVYRRLA